MAAFSCFPVLLLVTFIAKPAFLSFEEALISESQKNFYETGHSNKDNWKMRNSTIATMEENRLDRRERSVRITLQREGEKDVFVSLSNGGQQVSLSNGGQQVSLSNGGQVSLSNGGQVSLSNGGQVSLSNGGQVSLSNGGQVTTLVADGSTGPYNVLIERPSFDQYVIRVETGGIFKYETTVAYNTPWTWISAASFTEGGNTPEAICEHIVTRSSFALGQTIRVHNFRPNPRCGLLAISFCHDMEHMSCYVVRIFGFLSGKFKHTLMREWASEQGFNRLVPGRIILPPRQPEQTTKSNIMYIENTPLSQNGDSKIYNVYIEKPSFSKYIIRLESYRDKFSVTVKDYLWSWASVATYSTDGFDRREACENLITKRRLDEGQTIRLYGVKATRNCAMLGISLCEDQQHYACYVVDVRGLLTDNLKHTLVREFASETGYKWIPGRGDDNHREQGIPSWVQGGNAALSVQMGSSVPTVQMGRPIPAPQVGKPYPSVQFGNPVPTTQDGKQYPSVQFGNPVRTTQDGKPYPSVQFGNPVPTTQDGKPYPSVQFGNPVPTTQDGKPYPTVQFGNPVPTTQDGKPYPTVQFGNPISTTQIGEPYPTAQFGAPVPTKQVGGSYPTGGLGSPIPTPEVATPIPTEVNKPTQPTQSVNPHSNYNNQTEKADLNESAGDEACGIASAVGPLIAFGSPATLDALPWHVGVFMKPDNKHICGGSLVRSNLVISAAHCFHNSNDVLLDKSNFILAAGKLSRNFNESEPDQQNSLVTSLVIAERYRGKRRRFEHDIAFIVVNFKIDSVIRPVCVDWTGSALPPLADGDVGVVAGWGLTENNVYSDILMYARMPYIPLEKCDKKVPDTFFVHITADKFCAGNVNGPTVKPGDSGGGLTFLSKQTGSQNRRQWYLRGVVSVGAYGELTYSAFVDVSNFLPTMKNKL